MAAPLILFASSEIYPFSKTGGLGDVLGALPLALHRKGYNVAVITPFYGRLKTAEVGLHLVYTDCHVGYPWDPIKTDIYQADLEGMPIYFVHRGEYYDRRFYYNNHKGDYFDNCERFTFFSRTVMEWCRTLPEAPAVIHAHDWQAALTPAFLHFWRQHDREFAHTKSMLTIHNLAFQGRFSSRLFEGCGLPDEAWHMNGAEYYGDFNLLKAGIAYADMVTTVSPSYAEEILTEEFGCGLEGILTRRGADLRGILNGADYDVWDPQRDKYLPCTYSADNPSGKQECKRLLLQEMGMDPALEDRPLLGFIGRLRGQKGIDMLLEIMPRVMALDVGVIVLGEGNLEYEAQLLAMMEDYPGRLAARVSYTEDLAHRIQAGSDIFLMPSRYEPCGLTQMYALRYGTPPVATAVGGLIDTIVPYPNPQATGFTFSRQDPDGFYAAMASAIYLWNTNPQEWVAMRERAMRAQYSWANAADEYVQAYRDLGVEL